MNWRVLDDEHLKAELQARMARVNGCIMFDDSDALVAYRHEPTVARVIDAAMARVAPQRP